MLKGKTFSQKLNIHFQLQTLSNQEVLQQK